MADEDQPPPPADAAPPSPERAAPPAEDQAVSPAGAEAGGGATEADGGSRGRERSRSQHRERSRSEGKRDRRRSGSRDRRRRDRSRSDSRRRRRERSGSRRRHRSRSRSRDRRRSRERRRRWSPSRSRSRDRRRRSGSRSRSPKRPAAVAAAPLVPSALPGMAGLPGMPALAGLNPLMANPYLMPGLGGSQAVAGLSQATRRARELFVGNLPQPCADFQLQTFLNQALVALGLCKTTGKMPIIKCELNPGGKYAFVEFSDMMDCTCALAMDGIPFMGQPLNIKRPSSYQRPYGAPPDPAPLGAAALAALLQQDGNAMAGAAVATAMAPPPGAVPGAVPAAVPGAVPAAIPGVMPAAAPGGLALPGGVQAAALDQTTRKQRELFIGNLPQPCMGTQLQQFLNQALVALGLTRSTGAMPVLKCQVSPSGAFAFVEFSDVMDCTCALALDGIPYMGQPLRIARPKEYRAPFGAPPDPAPLGAAALQTLMEQQQHQQH